jgi:hypothetical protein
MTTLQKVKDYSLIEIESAYESVVEEYIDAVTAYIERYTGRIFTTDTIATERVFDGTDTGEIFIDDAVEITEVKDNGNLIDPVNYRLYPANRLPKTRIILPRYNFSIGAQNITVKAKWGYGAVPKDLEFAATVMVAGIINSQQVKSSGGEISSETIGRYSVSYAQGSSQSHDFSNAKSILKMYRKLSC